MEKTEFQDANGKDIYEGNCLAVMIDNNCVNSGIVEYKDGVFLLHTGDLLSEWMDGEYTVVLVGNL